MKNLWGFSVKSLIVLFVSTTLLFSSVPVCAADAPASSEAKTVLDAACGQGGNTQSCLYLAAWHWFRKAEVVIQPALKTVQVSAAVWTAAIVAKWIGGDAPILQYLIVVSRAGVQAGTVTLLSGAAVVIGGTLIAAGGLLLGSVTPAGNASDERPPDCDEILLPYQGPEGLQKLLQLPKDQFDFVIRCIPPNSDMGRFVQGAADNARQFEQQLTPR